MGLAQSILSKICANLGVAESRAFVFGIWCKSFSANGDDSPASLTDPPSPVSAGRRPWRHVSYEAFPLSIGSQFHLLGEQPGHADPLTESRPARNPSAAASRYTPPPASRPPSRASPDLRGTPHDPPRPWLYSV